uniref:Putative secreted protein n=1 Tax=Anopheles marajoara TaxID=58244 RepID=A0A2M4C8F6_9DIPT
MRLRAIKSSPLMSLFIPVYSPGCWAALWPREWGSPTGVCAPLAEGITEDCILNRVAVGGGIRTGARMQNRNAERITVLIPTLLIQQTFIFMLIPCSSPSSSICSYPHSEH